jgi:Dyp-type peroxidase family
MATTTATPTLSPVPKVRQAPAQGMLANDPTDPSRKTVFLEPVLDTENIQGAIIGGFNKSQRLLISLRVNTKTERDVANFKAWLRGQSNFVATAREVLTFNRLFKATRDRRKTEGSVKSTWMSLSLSYNLIRRLIDDAKFADIAFTSGLAERSPLLNDPQSGPFSRENWLVGGPKNAADLFIIIESDDPEDLLAEQERLQETIDTANATQHAGYLIIETLFVDAGANLPDPLGGHEHFGFLDGVSQPGLRGLLSEDKTDVLTLRQNPGNRDQAADPKRPVSPENKIEPAQGLPGQDLLYPGEFVFGYNRQIKTEDPNADGPNPNPGPDSLLNDPVHDGPAAPKWAKDGSFLVYRRLRQDVGAFHKFLNDTANAQGIKNPDNASASRLVGSRLVGRWPSGAPVERTPDSENIPLGNVVCNSNNFEFQDKTDKITKSAGDPFACEDNKFPRSVGDQEGARCPFSGHIRKAYPRDDVSKTQPTLKEADTQTHRLLRRGLPYGPVSASTPDVPFPDDDVTDRGLQFLCFQTSIENQFEFVIRNWVNDPNFKEPLNAAPDGTPKDQGGGYDPILGQSSAPNRERTFTITVPAGNGNEHAVKLKTTADWVHPTAGGYFFTPSISALQHELTMGAATEKE